MADIIYLTQEGYDKLKNELEDLKLNGRREAARAIAEARDKGDLSENAEYDAAKNAQGMLELRINTIEKQLMNARVIDESFLDPFKISLLSSVKLKNVKTGKEIIYKLVSESEANLKEGKISVTSPIGQGLLGKGKGDVAAIQTPGSLMHLEIVEIGA